MGFYGKNHRKMMVSWDLNWALWDLPSGYDSQFAIEHGHRNGELSYWKWWILKHSSVDLPEGNLQVKAEQYPNISPCTVEISPNFKRVKYWLVVVSSCLFYPFSKHRVAVLQHDGFPFRAMIGRTMVQVLYAMIEPIEDLPLQPRLEDWRCLMQSTMKKKGTATERYQFLM